MKSLVVANNKGGVSKTSVSQILGFYYAHKGFRVLLIDFDPQANLANRFLTMDKDRNGNWTAPIHPETQEIRQTEAPDFSGHSSIVSIFQKDAPVFPYPTAHPLISIIPPDTEFALRVLRLNEHESVQNYVRKWFKEILTDSDQPPYDVVIMDTPPSLSALTLSAIRGATHALIPCMMERKPYEGLMAVVTKINMENRKKPKPTSVIGVLPSNYDKRKTTHVRYFNKLKSDPSMSKYLIESPFYNREVIKTWDDRMAADPKEALSPFETNFFKAANRREIEIWCDHIRRHMFTDDQMKAIQEKNSAELAQEA